MKTTKGTRIIEVEFLAKRETEYSITREIEIPADLTDDQVRDYLESYSDGLSEDEWEEQDDTGICFDDCCVNWDEAEDPDWKTVDVSSN